MFQHFPSLKALHAFESAARLGSFNAAADELAVTPGAISYQIKQLEASLGQALFHRRTRRVELTDSGSRLYRTTHRLFQEFDAEFEQLAPRRAKNRLVVSVTTYFVTRWLSPRLGRFLNAHPDITVSLQHSVNDPDFSVADADVSIRWGDGRWADSQLQGSQSELLFNLPMIAVCSPKLLQGKRALKDPNDLVRYRLLRDQPGIDRWREWLQLAGVSMRSIDSGSFIVDPNVRVQSAIDGHGVVLANPLLQSDLESGELVEPFACRLHGYGYHLLSSSPASQSKAFKLFRDWLRNEIAV